MRASGRTSVSLNCVYLVIIIVCIIIVISLVLGIYGSKLTEHEVVDVARVVDVTTNP